MLFRSGMVKEKQKEYRDTYVKFNLIGACICILSPIALFVGAFSENELFMGIMLSVMLLTAGIGAVFFILAGVRHESMQKLLKEGDYSEKAKKRSGLRGAVFTTYWLLATTIYLVLLFASNDWQNISGSWHDNRTWLVWVIAALLFPIVVTICGLIEKKTEEKREK